MKRPPFSNDPAKLSILTLKAYFILMLEEQNENQNHIKGTQQIMASM